MNLPKLYVGRDSTGRIVLDAEIGDESYRVTFTSPREAAELADRLSEHAQDGKANAVYGDSHADQ